MAAQPDYEMGEEELQELAYQADVLAGKTPIILRPAAPAPAPAPVPVLTGVAKKRGTRTGGPATRAANIAQAAAQAPRTGVNIRTGLVPATSRAYQYVYRAHHGASKGLTAKQIRHLYRYRPKKRVSAATRERIRIMGAQNGPALKAAKALAKSQGRKMTKEDFYASGGMRPRPPGGR